MFNKFQVSEVKILVKIESQTMLRSSWFPDQTKFKKP